MDFCPIVSSLIHFMSLWLLLFAQVNKPCCRCTPPPERERNFFIRILTAREWPSLWFLVDVRGTGFLSFCTYYSDDWHSLDCCAFDGGICLVEWEGRNSNFWSFINHAGPIRRSYLVGVVIAKNVWFASEFWRDHGILPYAAFWRFEKIAFKCMRLYKTKT